MKQIAIKSALMRTVVVMLLTLGTLSASAQYYMNVVQKDGKIVQFLVPDIDNVFFSGQDSPAANYEYVDLGLSVKWATRNVGATKPEEYGDYYAWGETELNTDYSWSTYKWCNGSSSTLTKYCNNSSSGNNGFTDSKTTLDLEDDVAHIKWGGAWRMPTKAEQDDLRNNCTWTWYSSDNTEFNGVAGCKVTSNIEGYKDRFIFLPAAGYRGDTSLYNVGSGGSYWSSSLDTGLPYSAWGVNFSYSYNVSPFTYAGRCYGRSVRPVCP